jgi:hypothetical protein
MCSQPWWIVGLAIIASIYWGWRAYLHHRYPVEKPFREE